MAVGDNLYHDTVLAQGNWKMADGIMIFFMKM